MKYRKEIKNHAKSQKFGTLLAAFILASLIIAPFQVLNKLSEHYTFLKIYTFLGGVVSFVFIPVYYVGIKASALKVSRGERISVGQPFTEGFTGYWRKLGGALWKQLLLMLWLLIAIIPVTVFAVVSFGLNSIGDLANPINHFIETNLPGFLFMLLLYLVLMIPTFIKALSYSFTEYILAEYPAVKARDALKLSMRITYGRKWTLFVFHLSFIGWFLLIPLTFGLILFYLIPYYEIATATLYDSLKTFALNNGIISQSELEPIE